MTPKGAKKAKKSVETTDDVLMKEILAMGGSEKDMELFNDIDSGSEIEGDDNDIRFSKAKVFKKKTRKEAPTDEAEEPGLRNEVATFMKSLFGKALMDPTKMSEAAIEDEEAEDTEDDSEGELGDQAEEEAVGSESSWETEEEDDNADDAAADDDHHSDDDSMDDLPDELKQIAAQLNDKDRKRKADTAPATPTTTASPSAKKQKADTVKKTPTTLATKSSIPTTKASNAPSEAKDKKKLTDVKKQVSVILGKPLTGRDKSTTQKKALAMSIGRATTTTTKTAVTKRVAVVAKKAVATKAEPSKNPGWKLGDGWSKGFGDSDDDSAPTKQPATKEKKSVLNHRGNAPNKKSRK
ncbi:hypothetical protein BG004_000999 [Podila humilis]|nr:hypothetical protein BG004_000999 [Podila humilis]